MQEGATDSLCPHVPAGTCGHKESVLSTWQAEKWESSGWLWRCMS